MINVLLTACLVPALVPEPAAGMFLAPNTMLADLYYESPLGYIALFLVLTGFLAGAYGLLSVVLSFWIHNRFVVLLLPFALCMALDFMLQGTFLAGFSPTNMVFPYQPYPSIFWVVLLLIFLLWCLLALVLWLKGRSYEDI
jgi:hypothetical protein